MLAALALLALALEAQAVEWAAVATRTVSPGLVHRHLRAGSVSHAARWQVIAATSERMEDADDLLARVAAAAGKQPLSTYRGGLTGRYEILLDGFTGRRAARAAARTLGETLPDLRPMIDVRRVAQDETNPSGPWEVDVLEIDPRRFEVRAAHALDASFGVETTRSLAGRHAAVAAVNGGFFVTRGLLRGDSTGTLQVAGTLLSEPDRGRAVAGFYVEDGTTRALFGRPGLRAEARTADGAVIRIDGVNRAPKPDEVVLLTPQFHRTTLTFPGGVEWVLRAGRLESFHRTGSVAIPADGEVLSFGAERRVVAPPLGSAIEADAALDGGFARIESGLSAGPLLVVAGRRIEEPEREAIRRIFWNTRHPRTAAAVRADGTILLVTVDGRQPTWSVGMTLTELTDLLLALGAEGAINLDGGGSTTMVVAGEVVNRFSDASGERENGDALLVFPRGVP
jgi:hypothetical protein